MAHQFTNGATTTLASSITAAATTLNVASGTGSLFPVPNATDYFHATLADVAGNIEIVRVTLRASDSFTVLRAQEGTVARNFSAGDRVELRLTAAALNSVAQIDSPTFTGSPRGPTPATSDASTLLATTQYVAARVAADAPTKTGAGASGAWDIDISGSAVRAVTRATKTADTTIATTAFADALRSLLPSISAGTLALSDRGSLVVVTAGITVPSGVFTAGDVITLFNNTPGSIPLLAGSGLTLYQAGTASTGNRAMGARALAAVVFIAPNAAVVSGAGVS